MHALGQQSDAVATPNTVLQEVVRGYRWKDRILREAQVIVAVAPTVGLEKGE
jgi:molecular chaperone GrpE